MAGVAKKSINECHQKGKTWLFLKKQLPGTEAGSVYSICYVFLSPSSFVVLITLKQWDSKVTALKGEHGTHALLEQHYRKWVKKTKAKHSIN